MKRIWAILATLMVMLVSASIVAVAVHPQHDDPPFVPGHIKHGCFPTWTSPTPTPTNCPTPTPTASPSPTPTPTPRPTIVPGIWHPPVTISFNYVSDYSIVYKDGWPYMVVTGPITNETFTLYSNWHKHLV